MRNQLSSRNTLPQTAAIVSRIARISSIFIAAGFAFTFQAQSSDKSADFEAYSWMEQQLLSEKEALMARVRNEELIFFQTKDGSIVTFNRSAVLNILDQLAFLATTEPFASDIIRYLPPETRDIIATLQSVGLWSENFAAGRAIALIERKSDEARGEARRRVELEYNPLIEEVQGYAQDILQAHSNPAQSSGNDANLTSVGSYAFTVICPERDYKGTLEIFSIAGEGSAVQVNLNGTRAGDGTLSGGELAFEEEAYGHIWTGTITPSGIAGNPMDRKSSNNEPCTSWSAVGSN
jgi:hypothetical protein